MALFGHRKCDHAEELSALRAEVAELRKRVVACESTTSDVAATVYRTLKKIEARARREVEASPANQGQGTPGTVQPGTPLAAPPLTGARARIAARRAARGMSIPFIAEPEAAPNGVHP